MVFEKFQHLTLYFETGVSIFHTYCWSSLEAEHFLVVVAAEYCNTQHIDRAYFAD